MSAFEVKFIDFFLKNRVIVFCTLVTVLAAAARYGERSFVSYDMFYCLLEWYDQIKALGVESLGTQIGNYNLPYQFLIWVGTHVPIIPMYWIKIISIVFDFILAAEAALLVKDIAHNVKLAAFTYGLTLFLPEQLLNSALWGQCDAIYSAFLIISIRLLLKNKPRGAFFCLGLALSFKLQACFVIPFFIFYYMKQKDFSIIKAIWTVPGFYLLCLPSLIMGRSIFAPFEIYLVQTDAHQEMIMNFPSFWGFMGGDYATMKWAAIALTVFVLLCGFLFLLKREAGASQNKELMVLVAAWMTFTCVEFLPAMHERYGFFPFLLVAIVCLFYLKPIFIFSWTLTLLCVGVCYAVVFLHNSPPMQPLSMAMFCAWVAFTYGVYCEATRQDPLPENAKNENCGDEEILHLSEGDEKEMGVEKPHLSAVHLHEACDEPRHIHGADEAEGHRESPPQVNLA